MGKDLHILSSRVGYGIVIRLGGIFALLMLGLTWLHIR
jgi:hypothetical protein